MKKPFNAAVCLAALALGCAVLIAPSSLLAQAVEGSPAGHHDVSPPLISISPRAPRLGQHVRPVRPVPLAPGQAQPDPGLQTTSAPLVGTPNGPDLRGG